MVSVCREILCAMDTMTVGIAPGQMNFTGKVADLIERAATILSLSGHVHNRAAG